MVDVLRVGLLLVVLTLVSCGQSAPTCLDAEQLVVQIVKQEYEALAPRVSSIQRPNGFNDFGLTMSSARPSALDDTILKISCEATLTTRFSQESDIEYTAQYTEDGDLYVSVYGLNAQVLSALFRHE